MTLEEKFSETMELNGPQCLDATRCDVQPLDVARARTAYCLENLTPERISGEEISDTDNSDPESLSAEEASASYDSDSCAEDAALAPMPTLYEGRCIGVVRRARQNVDLLIEEDGEFMAYVLNLLRTENVREIGLRYSRPWVARRAYDGVRFFKIDAKSGTNGIVVLVMLDKVTDDRALIVNAFRRNHKGGSQYEVYPSDVDMLLTGDQDDCYRDLRLACAQRD